jgi:hypothetical protein
MKKLLYFVPFILILALIACNEEPPSGGNSRECSDPEGDAWIRLNYPEGGETFKVGDKIEILYSIDVEEATGTVAEITKDGRIYEAMSEEESIPNTKSEGYECITYSWTIPSNFVTESNSKIKIKVSAYNNKTKKSVSDAFTIEP